MWWTRSAPRVDPWRWSARAEEPRDVRRPESVRIFGWWAVAVAVAVHRVRSKTMRNYKIWHNECERDKINLRHSHAMERLSAHVRVHRVAIRRFIHLLEWAEREHIWIHANEKTQRPIQSANCELRIWRMSWSRKSQTTESNVNGVCGQWADGPKLRVGSRTSFCTRNEIEMALNTVCVGCAAFVASFRARVQFVCRTKSKTEN